jgi:hypothetical protein
MKVKNLQRGTVNAMELGGAIMSINYKQYGYYISSRQTFIAQCSYARSFGLLENSTIRMVVCRLAPLHTGLDCSRNYHPTSSNYHPCYRYAHRTDTLEAASEPEGPEADTVHECQEARSIFSKILQLWEFKVLKF